MENVETVKYVRKPLYVEAVQVTDENFLAVAKWCQGDVGVIGSEPGGSDVNLEDAEFDTSKHYIRIRVHNPQSQRQTRAQVSDWILYTDRGYKIYMDKAFKDNFDLAESE